MLTPAVIRRGWTPATIFGAVGGPCYVSRHQRALYGASNNAVLALTYAMATDHVAAGVRVNCVSPATVSTPFAAKTLLSFSDPGAERAALNARQATGRMVTPDEVANAILYLAHPRSTATMRTALEVDGGFAHVRVRSATA